MGKGGGGGDGGQNKAKPGINIGLNLAPEEITNKNTMSGLFTILAAGAVAILGIAHVAQPIKTFLFGIDGETSKGGALADAKPNELVEVIKTSANMNDGNRQWLIKEAFSSLGDDAKSNIKSWMNK